MKNRNLDLNALLVDIFDHVLSEWLCRRGLYSKFVDNLMSARVGPTTPRAAVREFVSLTLDSPNTTFSDVIVSAFPFDSTPEGLNFWFNVSLEWEHFAKSLPHFI